MPQGGSGRNAGPHLLGGYRDTSSAAVEGGPGSSSPPEGHATPDGRLGHIHGESEAPLLLTLPTFFGQEAGEEATANTVCRAKPGRNPNHKPGPAATLCLRQISLLKSGACGALQESAKYYQAVVSPARVAPRTIRNAVAWPVAEDLRCSSDTIFQRTCWAGP